MTDLTRNLPAWAIDAAITVGAATLGILAALVVHRVAFAAMERLTAASESHSDDVVVAHLKKPARWALIALGIVLAAREIPMLDDVWQKFAGFLMPALIGWIALSVVKAFVEAAVMQADITVADNLRARRKRTRLAIFSRIATFIIMFITIGLMLLSIPGVREIGVTLMASAGLAGLAVGAAAQPALKSLIAGLQMALTEPIRIDDLVTIDGETGRVEDIRATYVIVRIWDDRRMIVPTSRFLDVTFITSTRYGSDATGTIMLHVRPDADIDTIRAAFMAKVKAHPKWDRRNAALQVTNSTVDAVELRLVVTAANPGDNFDMRADIRESMLNWLRENQPGATGPVLPIAPLTAQPD